MTSILRDRFMPAVVTARNTPGTHNDSAVYRDVLRRDIDFVAFESWVLVLAALLLTLMTINWIFVGV